MAGDNFAPTARGWDIMVVSRILPALGHVN